MSARFLAFSAGDPQRVALRISNARRRLRLAPEIAIGRSTILVTPDSPVVTSPDGTTVVVGRLFCSETGAPVSTLSGGATPETHDSTLLRTYWGSYVAFSAGVDGDLNVLRDPSGSLPCYSVADGEVTVFASDLDMLLAAGISTPEVDWAAMAQHLRASGLWSEATCLKGVRDLPPGFASLAWNGRRSETRRWSPWDFVTSAPGMSVGDAVELVREGTQTCVRAWAARHRHILLMLSGGLDSSIVAACLQDSVAKVTGVTLFAEEPVSDERDYSRLVAAAVGMPLIEHQYRLDHVDVGRSTSEHLARPNGKPFLQDVHHALQSLADKAGCDVIFDGDGGDSVYALNHSARPIADRVLSEGLGPGAFQTLDDVCRMTRCGYWEAGNQALQRILRSDVFTPHEDLRFLSEARKSKENPIHPWLSARGKQLPGKIAHVASVARSRDVIEGGAGRTNIPSISPLRSQPLIERCLAIPSWLWCSDGRNRSIARRAFADRLPKTITERASKGGPDGFSMQIYESNRSQLREMLVAGLLARNGIVDVGRIAAYFDDPRPPRDADHLRIMVLADAEAWAQAWTTRQCAVSGGPTSSFTLATA